MWDLCDLQILANNLLYLNRPVGHCLQKYMLFSALQSYAHISLVEIWWGAAAVGDLRCTVLTSKKGWIPRLVRAA